MRKLYLLMDEWDNDRNFLGGELDLLCDRYDVTIICNSASVMKNDRAAYHIYRRGSVLPAVTGFLRMLTDPDFYGELGRVLKEKAGKGVKLSETVRFYLNAYMFARYMKKNGFLEDGAIYYSYWFFWKCYAITHEINKYPNSRVFTRTHQYDLYDHALASGYQPFKLPMDEKLECIVFIAEYGRDYYLKKYDKEKGDKYKLYYLGTRSADKLTEYRRQDPLTLVSCSSIIERKRVARIAEALALVDDVNIRWIHFGSGAGEEELRNLSRRLLDCKDNISYELKGYVKNEVLHDFYRVNTVDAFITASSSEGNPVSVMEAMSYGIPVIAPDICNFANMINGCGILVSAECTGEELAAAIREMFKMPEDKYLKLRDKSRAGWQVDFDADVNNLKFVEEVVGRM